MAKFTISTDSCVDSYKTQLEKNNIRYIILKRIVNGNEIEEMYDNEKEYEKFYEELKKGALPITSQLNLYELHEYFLDILNNTDGDIIHISLSSGLSGTYENAKKAAEDLNATLFERKIYVFDSLSASRGIAMLVDRLMEYRDNNVDAKTAVEKLEHIRAHQQSWVTVGSLFHLKRGGRISMIKAAIGTLINLKPIIVINSKGKLVVENTVKGTKKTISYFLDKIQKFGVEKIDNFFDKPIYLIHSCEYEFAKEVETAILEKYPTAKINIGLIGPIIGTHVGEGSVAILFEGAQRLDI